MSFNHHYYRGAVDAHAREVLELHRAAARVGRVEQWMAAVDYMEKLERDIAATTAERDRLAGLLRKGKRNMSAEQLHEWQMQTDAALAELNPPTPTAPTNGAGDVK